MKTVNHESLKNEKSTPRAEGLTDLPVTEAQAEQLTGGRFDHNGHGTHVAGTIGAVSN